MAAGTLRHGTVWPSHPVGYPVKPADHQPVFIEAAKTVLIQGAHDPLRLPHGIVSTVSFCHGAAPREDGTLRLLIAGLDPSEEVKEFSKGMVVETLLAAVLVAAVTGKSVARRGLIIGLPHAPVKIPNPSGKGIDGRLISGEERRKNAHALLQDRDEIISQVA